MTKQEFEKSIDSLGESYEKAKTIAHRLQIKTVDERYDILKALTEMRDLAAIALQQAVEKPTKALNDLDKISLMASNNQDVRMSVELVEAKTVKAGGLVTMGVDANTIQKICINQDEYLVALYVINRKQFNEY